MTHAESSVSSLRNGVGENPQPRPAQRPVVERIAGWSAIHKKTVVFGWLLIVVAVFATGQFLGSSNLPLYDPGQPGQAEHVLQQLTNNGGAQPTEAVLISERGTASGRGYPTDPSMQQAVRQVVAALSRLPDAAADIQSPLNAGGRSLVSPDGRSVLVTFTVPGNSSNADQTVPSALNAVAAVQAVHPGLIVAESGDASISRATSQVLDADFRKAEYTTVPITLILLLLVFGALIAAGIPVLLAISAVATAISLLAILSRWVPEAAPTSEVVLVIGMAVGVDYSLFYLRREREERAAGRTNTEALGIAAATSGRAIMVSGITVMISLAGLLLTRIEEFTGITVGAIAVVGITVVGSVTVLPALLSWLGGWADRGRVPFLGRRRAAARPSRMWAALVRRVVRKPALWGGVATVALLALAAPATGMRFGYPAIDAPAGIPEIQTASLIQAAFGQNPAPAQIVVTGADVTSRQVSAAVAALRARAAQGGAIREPVTTTILGGGRALLIEMPLAGNGADSTSYHALATLEDQILPATLGTVRGISYAVAGDTAADNAWTSQLHTQTPVVLIAVGVLAFLLLMIAFRSLLIPLVSIVLNLLSVSAAYGLITLIFQDGRLQGLLGYTAFGGIIAWVPLFLFVFLFGISMDYHVFIVSRIREQASRGTPTRDAVVTGIASSAGVVTSAALIMMAVFSVFATLSLIDLKILGIGAAAAILIDATIVRGILLPAALTLLGERSWYAPRWLQRHGLHNREMIAADPLTQNRTCESAMPRPLSSGGGSA